MRDVLSGALVACAVVVAVPGRVMACDCAGYSLPVYPEHEAIDVVRDTILLCGSFNCENWMELVDEDDVPVEGEWVIYRSHLMHAEVFQPSTPLEADAEYRLRWSSEGPVVSQFRTGTLVTDGEPPPVPVVDAEGASTTCWFDDFGTCGAYPATFSMQFPVEQKGVLVLVDVQSDEQVEPDSNASYLSALGQGGALSIGNASCSQGLPGWGADEPFTLRVAAVGANGARSPWSEPIPSRTPTCGLTDAGVVPIGGSDAGEDEGGAAELPGCAHVEVRATRDGGALAALLGLLWAISRRPTRRAR